MSKGEGVRVRVRLEARVGLRTGSRELLRCQPAAAGTGTIRVQRQ